MTKRDLKFEIDCLENVVRRLQLDVARLQGENSALRVYLQCAAANNRPFIYGQDLEPGNPPSCRGCEDGQGTRPAGGLDE